MLIYYDNEFGDVIADECADCEHSYVDNLFYEWMCKKNTCKYTESEQQRILDKLKAELKADCQWK